MEFLRLELVCPWCRRTRRDSDGRPLGHAVGEGRIAVHPLWLHCTFKGCIIDFEVDCRAAHDAFDGSSAQCAGELVARYRERHPHHSRSELIMSCEEPFAGNGLLRGGGYKRKGNDEDTPEEKLHRDVPPETGLIVLIGREPVLKN